MPNPGKPAELKRKLGSKGYAKAASAEMIVLPAVSGTPEPLATLGDAGMELWNRTWARGETWISPTTDIHLLQMTCEQLDEREQLRAYVLANVEAWHERSALRELEKNIRSSLSLLGFTPTDRMKLGVAEVKAKSKLEELMARKAARG
jgi:hypothetical protein